MSNSKLTVHQKAELKEFKADNKGIEFYSFPEIGVTVGIERTGNTMGRFAVSIASDTETKFRRKVGEFNTAVRFMNYEVLPVWIGSRDMENVAHSLANAVISEF